MEESPTTPAPREWRTAVVRSTSDRIVAGLAGGLGNRFGIPAVYVRAAFVVAAFAGGIGVILYALGWLLFTDDTEARPTVAPPASTRQRLGIALAFLGFLFAAHGLGLWFGDVVVWPVAFVSFGLAALWDRSDYDYRSALSRATGAQGGRSPSRVRLLIGALLMVLGAAVLLNALDALRSMQTAALAVALTAAGFFLAFGPWVWRLAGDLAAERRERIRSEERSEMAAHLHDSVLQTLALIQRTDDPKRMVTLARAQERELREWLYTGDRERHGDTLKAALDAAASHVEQDHDVPIDVVVVGDRAMDARLAALVDAASEAMKNAARHSAADHVSVFAEVREDEIEVFVTDQGKGFDPALVPVERHGIANSIRARMERHRGSATITSVPGEGTEVHLTMEAP